jgi:cob(I)alamin adenosyltransferase
VQVSTTEVTSPVARAFGDLPDLERELGSGAEGVSSLVHRGRAGVRRLTAERDLVAFHPERSQHDTQRQVECLQHRALLDVELEIGGCAVEAAARRERAV